MQWISTGKAMSKYKPYSLQEVISMINDRFGYDMEKHVALQRVIDAQFVSSAIYFKVLFTLYILGHVLPFII